MPPCYDTKSLQCGLQISVICPRIPNRTAQKTQCINSEMFQAESVGDAAFGCDWVGTPIAFQRCLIFIIATANKRFQLTAGKFVPVSNLTMINVGKINILFYFFMGQPHLIGPGFLCVEGSVSHSDATFSSTPLNKRSVRRRDLYPITHTCNTHKRQTFMTSAEFEPTIPANELPLTQALERATTSICKYSVLLIIMYSNIMQLISYNVKLPNYLEKFENHHDGLRIDKCCKVSTNYTIKTYLLNIQHISAYCHLCSDP
jgi:hypothetical protein